MTRWLGNVGRMNGRVCAVAIMVARKKRNCIATNEMKVDLSSEEWSTDGEGGGGCQWLLTLIAEGRKVCT